MTNKTKKISILTTALAGSLIATSIGAIALSACATGNNNTNNTTPEDPNSEFEGNAFSKTIDWNNTDEVAKLIKDDQGLVFSSESKIEVIAIDPKSESTEITIPSSVRAITGYKDSTQSLVNNREGGTTVNKGAFEGNKKITKVSFAGNTYNIGKQAFKNATSLKTIQLPKTLNIIDNYAFEGCTSLELFDLSNVKIIGHSAFKGAFPAITVTRNGETVEQPTTAISFKKVVSIGNNAFENAKIKEITFNENTQLRNIGVAAFKGATLDNVLDLSSLTNLTEIENETFADTKGLTQIKLPENITSLGTSVFSGTSAATLDLSNIKATSIPSKTFLNASSLSSLTLPTTIASFGDNSFQGTTKLTSLTLPTNLTTLGSNVFNAEYDQNTSSKVTVKPSGVTSLDFTNTKVTQIPDNAFLGMTTLKTLTLNPKTAILGAYMLKGSEVTSLDLSKTTTLTTIPEYTFNGSKLASLDLSKTQVTTLKAHSFQNTADLKSLKLPETLETIEENTFNLEFKSVSMFEETQTPIAQPSGVTSLDFTNTKVTTLPNNVFAGCNKLSSVNLNNDTQIIPTNAFAGSGITSITLPENVTTIGDNAFSNITNLSSISFKTAAATNSTKLDFTNGTKVNSIGANAFGGVNKVTEADLSKATSLTTIPTGIFSGSSTLATVTLPESITTISTGAFSKNGALSKLGFKTAVATAGKLDFTNGTNVSSIGENAFDGTVFTEADLSKANVTIIPAGIFSGAKELSKVSLNPNTTTISTGAFVGNTKLASLDFKTLTELKTIDTNNFNGAAFTSLELNKTKLTEIKENTFVGLTGNLATVDLPVTITKVADNSLTVSKTVGSNTITSNLNINYMNINDQPTAPDSVKNATKTSELSSLGFNKLDNPDLSIIGSLTTISGGTFTGSTTLENLTLPAKATTFSMETANNLSTAAFHENNTLNMLEYVNFGNDGSNFNNQKLVLSESEYSNKITNQNSKVLEVIAKLMNSVGRKDNLTNADIMNNSNPKEWPTTAADWFTTDVTSNNLKEANKWVEGSSDTGNTTLPDFNSGTKTQLNSNLTSQNKQIKEVFYKHNGVVWKWTQKRIDTNQVIITVETFDGHGPLFYKTTHTPTVVVGSKAVAATTNNIALFGNNTSSKKEANTLKAKEVKIKLDISVSQG